MPRDLKVLDEDKKIYVERKKRYGDHLHGHKNLGLLWTGLLQNHYGIRLAHPIPASLAELMMAANKLNRAAVNPKWKDNYHDGRIYLTLAEDAASKEKR